MAQRQEKPSVLPLSHLKNETNATVTSQVHLEETQQENDPLHTLSENVTKAKNVYFYSFCSVITDWKNQHAASVFCFPGDVSVLKRNLTFLSRERYCRSPAMFISPSLAHVFFFFPANI